MGSIYLRKDGRWEARISLGSVNGKRQSRSFYGRTKEEAVEKLFGSYTSKMNSDITNLTVKELCEEWLSVCSQRVKMDEFDDLKKKCKTIVDSKLAECVEFGLPVAEFAHTIEEQEAVIKAFRDKVLAENR